MTQLEAARQNIITPEMRTAAIYEDIPPKTLCDLIARGEAVLPANKNRSFQKVMAVGSGLRVKVNANIGTSDSASCIEAELIKLDTAVQAGADAVMDLSTGGDLAGIRTKVLEQSPLMVGTVPVYSLLAGKVRKSLAVSSLTADDYINELEVHARAGVDFVTLHAGITDFVVHQLNSSERCLGMVSRGGALIKRWMKETGENNPFYSRFNDVLAICKEHDVTLSLGDGLRPGAIADAGDRPQVAELVVLGELAARARNTGVQVMIEGPGHVPYGDIDMHIKLMKRLCGNAPAYVLGPLPTDIAAGHDHITAAIGGAAAAAAGADFLCYVTPSEHLCLPNADDVRQGVMAARIAAHIGDSQRIGRHHIGDKDQLQRHMSSTADWQISLARKKLDWEEIFNNSLDPELSRKRKGRTDKDCSMCGKLCAIRNDQA
jgi:phosphomethylpyrimidine synthase